MSPHRKLAILVSVMVVLALSYGLYLAGSPGTARQIQFDQQRLNDLHNLSSRVINYYQENGQLPPSLEEIDSDYDSSLSDPATGKEYEYQVTSDTGYRLCAEFAFSSEEAEQMDGQYRAPRPVPVKPGAGNQYPEGSHQAGRHCWDLTVETKGCRLMTDPATGEVDCFGCARGKCRAVPAGWEAYVRPPGTIGIPYACFESDAGCALAQ